MPFIKYEPVSLRVVIAILQDKLQNTVHPYITKNDLLEVFEKALAAEQSVHADAGDSVASSDISNASSESTSQTETKPAQRG